MKNSEKLKFITDKCILANPEIVELKLGCRFIWKASHPTFYGTYTIVDFDDLGDGQFTYMAVHKERKRDVEDVGKFDERLKTEKQFKIIGRPIRLADILLALRLDDIDSPEMLESLEIETVCLMWNKYDNNLEEQTPEIIDSIYELLHD